ncbi:hypothetical protein [Haloarcula argentinensis]
MCGRDEPAPTERTDPREKLTQDELAEVNEQAMRISDEVKGGWSRAVVAKQLSEKVQRGRDVTKAVLETLEELKAVPRAIVPIADVPDVPVGEVTTFYGAVAKGGAAANLPSANEAEPAVDDSHRKTWDVEGVEMEIAIEAIAAAGVSDEYSMQSSGAFCPRRLRRRTARRVSGEGPSGVAVGRDMVEGASAVVGSYRGVV